jgi:hypothetical protein
MAHWPGERLTSPYGQPLCAYEDVLHDYLAAMVNQDTEAMEQNLDCKMLKPGVRVRVLEDVPSESIIGHTVKIEAFGPDGSVTGYSLSLGLQPK